MRYAVLGLAAVALLASCGPKDADGDAVPWTVDCDDNNAAVFPGAPELCDEIDNNCNGAIDEQPVDAPFWYFDRDGDGFGDDRVWVQECVPLMAGYVEQGGDCDDSDRDAFPGGVETCDGSDNDCDGAVDEGSPEAEAWYADLDGDGFGDPDGLLYACYEPEGFVKVAGDCDDSDPLQFPDADEYCNGEDDDCDEVVDEPGVVDGTPTYEDKDSDGLGDGATEQRVCTPGADAVLNGDDCDDGSSTVQSGCTCSDYSDGDLVIDDGETIILDAGEHHFKRVEINEGGILKFKPGEPTAIYALQVDIQGTIDVRGGDGERSASGSPPKGGAGGPGGGGGGGGGNCGNGSGSGGAPNGEAAPGGSRSRGGNGGVGFGLPDGNRALGGLVSSSTGYGGGGGGHLEEGRKGSTASGSGSTGGLGHGTSDLSFDFAGGGGGAGGGANGGGGGGGGGALKIFASYITITGRGEINADGGAGGGKSNGGCSSGGGGGGGGGAVWLHGDVVTLDESVVQALGGRGASTGVSWSGGTGADGRIRISGLETDLKARRITPAPYTDTSAPPCPLPSE